MNWNIITSAPLWFLPLGILLAIALAWVVYSGPKFKEEMPRLRWLLGGLRALAIFLLCLLLFGPILKTQESFREDPIVLFAQDNSESVVAGADSSFVKGDYIREKDRLIDELEKYYEVDRITFGEDAKLSDSIDFNEQLTNFDGLAKTINTHYQHRYVKALIIASDGAYNSGKNPLYAFGQFQYPIYTIALGDTVQYPDIEILNLKHNATVLKGNLFPVEVGLSFLNTPNTNYSVELYMDGKLVEKKRVFADSKDFYKNVSFQVKAENGGNKSLEVKVYGTDKDGKRLEKNFKSWIKVLDQKQKVAILIEAPHPDVAALKGAIGHIGNFEAEVYNIADFKKAVKPYDLMILYQVGKSSKEWDRVFAEAKKYKTSLLLVLGMQTNVQLLNEQQEGFEFSGKKGVYEDAYPVFAKGFSLFKFDDKEQEVIETFPPLRIPLINISGKAQTEVWVKQKIGSLKTDRPLIAFTDVEHQKIGLIAGESIWRWKMANYQNEQTHADYQSLIAKMVKYLSVKKDNSALRVDIPSELAHNKALKIEASLYNASMEKVNNVPLQFTLTDEAGESLAFEMSASGDHYYLDAGKLSPGLYKWEASAKLGNTKYDERGELLIKEINIEQIGSKFNHELLKNIALQSGGKMIYPNDMESLVKLLKEDRGASIVHYQANYKKLIDFALLLSLVIVLFIIEWFLRKYNGIV